MDRARGVCVCVLGRGAEPFATSFDVCVYRAISTRYYRLSDFFLDEHAAFMSRQRAQLPITEANAAHVARD